MRGVYGSLQYRRCAIIHCGVVLMTTVVSQIEQLFDGYRTWLKNEQR